LSKHRKVEARHQSIYGNNVFGLRGLGNRPHLYEKYNNTNINHPRLLYLAVCGAQFSFALFHVGSKEPAPMKHTRKNKKPALV
jgi:hypothetical protein